MHRGLVVTQTGPGNIRLHEAQRVEQARLEKECQRILAVKNRVDEREPLRRCLAPSMRSWKQGTYLWLIRPWSRPRPLLRRQVAHRHRRFNQLSGSLRPCRRFRSQLHHGPLRVHRG